MPRRALPIAREAPSVDVLRVPVIGPWLRRPSTRSAVRVAALVLALALVVDGFLGPSLAPKNLATVVTWVHFRGLLVLVLVFAGNACCYACPFILARDAARRWIRPRRNWPRLLRTKWLAALLLGLVLLAYEGFDLWARPAATAGLILSYFAAVLGIDVVFRHASFCAWICPIGQFNFLASLLSPLELRVKQQETCAGCRTKDCLRGRRTPAPEINHPRRVLAEAPVQRRGCELGLYLPAKQGNMNCTFCLDCVYACPADNIALASRLPGDEIWYEGPRSGLGRLLERKDFAALAVVFTFGALLNAFAMVSPVYELTRWVSARLGTQSEAVLLLLLFLAGLVLAPTLLIAGAAWLSRALGTRRESLRALATRHVFGLVPLGVGVWLSHYAFHFLTGYLTAVPVVQRVAASMGIGLLGGPNWRLGGLSTEVVYPLELGFLALGFLISLTASVRLTRGPRRAALPWVAVCAVLFGFSVWLLSQPMEMRGTFL